MQETAQGLYHSLENQRWSFLDGKTQYTHSEILAILATDEWTDPNFPPE
jgi:hypothetical protein